VNLSDAIDQYLKFRAAAYRPSTVVCAKQALSGFLAETGNINTKHLMPRHAERYQTVLMTKGQKPNTINSRVSQVSSFSKWLVANRYTPAHFVSTVRSIPVPRRSRLRVPAHDFARLLDCAERPDRRMTVALGLFLFLRGGEIKTLRVGDVDLDQGLVHVTIHKTNDSDEMPICWELDQELRRWFVEYQRDIGRPLRNTDFLIPGHRGYQGWLPRLDVGNYLPERMSLRPYTQVRSVLSAAGYEITGENGKAAGEGVHTLRRSGARALYEALVEGRLGDAAARDDALRQVMTALHHKSVVTTEHYIGLERDRQRRDQTIRGVRLLPARAANVVSLKEAQGE
jgi:integrase